MYTISVPFMLSQVDTYGADGYIEQLKRIGADIVVLALDCYVMNEEKQRAVFASLRRNIPLFQKAGFRVGVWVWTFMICEDNNFIHITSPNGKVSRTEVCPSDEAFRAFAYEYLGNIAQAHPDIILFDDDFRYGFFDCGLGCACQNHRDYMSTLLGERVEPDGLGEKIFSGGRNKYRSAFLQANGHFMRAFARGVREAVDTVDASIRVGLCACMDVWDFAGVSDAELARILAGNTKPLLRLIGAPYWAYTKGWGNRLSDVIELERMESSWCGEGIELLAEGDTYPRPRFTCSTNMLEGYDMALRASGALSGIHKYMFDYYGNATYETAYITKHIQNQPLYEKIDAFFGDKAPTGIRVYEMMQKFEDMEVPSAFAGKDDVQNLFFGYASRILTAHSLPTTYQGLGTGGIAFGENAKMLDSEALSRGVILDIRAAEILKERGVDVGLVSVGQTIRAKSEYYPEKSCEVGLFSCPVCEISVDEKVVVESLFRFGEKSVVGSYRYENEKGEKFLVFAFEGYCANEHALKQYTRGEQIADAIEWMGHTLPAKMLGNPDCYLLAKENEEGLAVFVGNFFSDECINTTVTLARDYKSIEFFGASGRLEGNTVRFDDIPPYASVGFVVR